MSFSAGVFSINTAGQPVVTGTVISSTAFNALTSDLATGLSTAVLKDGTQVLTANIPFAGFKITGAGAASANGEFVRWQQASAGVMTTLGDTLFASAANTPARMPATASVAAHATTTDPWNSRETILTGTAVTFTDIVDADYVGQVAWVYMNAAHIWTDGAVFDVQGGANYTAAVGDWVRINAVTVSTFDVTIFKASGAPQVPARTRQVFTSGTAATYTTPTGCIAINVRAVGPGGGGAAAITNSGANGSAATTFSGGTMSAGAGAGGTTSAGAGGAGGTATGGDINIAGGSGSQGTNVTGTSPGGVGGVSAFGGAGGSGANAAGLSAAANSGSGGGGGGNNNAAAGGGGGAGAYCERLITSPAATYTYTIGTGGAGGSAGTNAGGNGADGIIIVDEFYS